MNLKLLQRMVRRNKDKLAQQGVNNPFCEAEDDFLVFTDGFGAVFLPPTPELLAWMEKGGMQPKVDVTVYRKAMGQFVPKKKFDVVVFKTTVADIWDWLLLGAEECPVCKGVAPCTLPKADAGMGEGFPPHQGWVGSIGIDRRRLQEHLAILDLPGEQLITLSGYFQPATATQGFSGGIRLDVNGHPCAILMGLNDCTDGKSAFQKDGKYHDVKLKHSEGKKNK